MKEDDKSHFYFACLFFLFLIICLSLLNIYLVKNMREKMLDNVDVVFDKEEKQIKNIYEYNSTYVSDVSGLINVDALPLVCTYVCFKGTEYEKEIDLWLDVGSKDMGSVLEMYSFFGIWHEGDLYIYYPYLEDCELLICRGGD